MTKRDSSTANLASPRDLRMDSWSSPMSTARHASTFFGCRFFIRTRMGGAGEPPSSSHRGQVPPRDGDPGNDHRRATGREDHARPGPAAAEVQSDRSLLRGGGLADSKAPGAHSGRRSRSLERRREGRRSEGRDPGIKAEGQPGKAEEEQIGSRQRAGSPRGEVREPSRRKGEPVEEPSDCLEEGERRSRSARDIRREESPARARRRRRLKREHSHRDRRRRPRQKSEQRSAPPEGVKREDERRRKGQERPASLEGEQVRQTKREPSQRSRQSIKREQSRSSRGRISATPARGDVDVRPPASRFLREFLQEEETGNLSAAQLIRHLVLQLMETDSPLKEYMLWSLQSPTRREGKMLNLFPLPFG